MAENNLQLYRPEDFVVYATKDLSEKDLATLNAYVAAGGYPLSPDTAAKIYELFLNGSDAHEIHRINPAFPLGGILDAQVRYRWTETREKYASELQVKVRDKVMNVQLQTTDLMADIMSAARKKYGDKLKKFIQSGDEKDLDGVLNVGSIKELVKITEGLLKVTGQDRVQKIKTEDVKTLNVNGVDTSDLDEKDAAQILKILSDSRKKKAKDVPQS